VSKWLLILIPVVLITLGQTSAKYGALKIVDENNILNIYIAFGYAFLILRGLVWVFILKKIKLSFAYPFVSLSYVFILAISYYAFGEVIRINNIIGTLFIVGGVCLMGLGEIEIKRSLND